MIECQINQIFIEFHFFSNKEIGWYIRRLSPTGKVPVTKFVTPSQMKSGISQSRGLSALIGCFLSSKITLPIFFEVQKCKQQSMLCSRITTDCPQCSARLQFFLMFANKTSQTSTNLTERAYQVRCSVTIMWNVAFKYVF